MNGMRSIARNRPNSHGEIKAKSPYPVHIIHPLDAPIRQLAEQFSALFFNYLKLNPQVHAYLICPKDSYEQAWVHFSEKTTLNQEDLVHFYERARLYRADGVFDMCIEPIVPSHQAILGALFSPQSFSAAVGILAYTTRIYEYMDKQVISNNPLISTLHMALNASYEGNRKYIEFYQKNKKDAVSIERSMIAHIIESKEIDSLFNMLIHVFYNIERKSASYSFKAHNDYYDWDGLIDTGALYPVLWEDSQTRQDSDPYFSEEKKLPKINSILSPDFRLYDMSLVSLKGYTYQPASGFEIAASFADHTFGSSATTQGALLMANGLGNVFGFHSESIMDKNIQDIFNENIDFIPEHTEGLFKEKLRHLAFTTGIVSVSNEINLCRETLGSLRECGLLPLFCERFFYKT